MHCFIFNIDQVDLHEGCGRTKLFWLLALADSTTLKAMLELRGENQRSRGSVAASTCRFCGAPAQPSLLSPAPVCQDSDCQVCNSSIILISLLVTRRLHISIDSYSICVYTNFWSFICIYMQVMLIWCIFLNFSQEYSREACVRTHDCGHLCGGLKGEASCLPCLHGCANTPSLKQDADDMCMICFSEALSAAPAIQVMGKFVQELMCL